MQFQVPQFIDTEDKILGPLSLKQFFALAMVAGFCFILFFLIGSFFVWMLLSIVIMGSAVALTIVKVNGRPLLKVFLSAIKYYWQPQTYVWQPEDQNMKTQREITVAKKPGLSLDSIIMGMALKKTWQKLQTGTSGQAKKTGLRQFSQQVKERYQIFEKITGERKAAKRVDYR